LESILERLAGKRAAVFLDYDGTLVPIVPRPELARMSHSMREAVRELSRRCPVAIVSGRDRAEVERLVDIDSLVYAGSHGFDLAGQGFPLADQAGEKFRSALAAAARELEERIGQIDGVWIEPKRYAVAVHYRLVPQAELPRVEEAVREAALEHPELLLSAGKAVYEFRPNIEWNKGKAVLWLLRNLGLDRADVVPIYVGDDLTDEDAFEALVDRGIGIVVGDPGERPTRAQYILADCAEVERFLRELATASPVA
jgi:alpha,alpha-trehalase